MIGNEYLRKNIQNTSPVLFQTGSKLQTKASTADSYASLSSQVFSESIDLDTDDSNYKRSYVHISSSHLHTYGGKVEYIEASFREARSRNNEYNFFSKNHYLFDVLFARTNI